MNVLARENMNKVSIYEMNCKNCSLFLSVGSQRESPAESNAVFGVLAGKASGAPELPF